MLEKIRDILEEYVDVPREQITLNASFVEDLGLSSLDVVDIIVTFGEEFEVEVSDRKLTDIITVKDVISILEDEEA